ncbi:MAG: saccharopine dehydrogenase C-terminal domain-containing protein [Bacteroidales bacterium]
MKKILVLGTGLVGSTICRDLAPHFSVMAADRDENRLASLKGVPNLETVGADLTDPHILGQLAGKADLVIGALPGYLGFESVRQCILAGRNMVDISFFPEDPFELDDLAREKGVTVITDCGVAPGMSNLILGYHNAHMSVSRFRCLVGGLPVTRTLPWQYKAGFSPIDVLEEYTRPARYLENGKLVVKEALTDVELVEVPGIGTLEAFNSDGLRSLLTTVSVADMVEKTLRYPGTADLLRLFRENGFFSQDALEINGLKIRPVDLTARLLFPQWELKPGEKEFTVMQISIDAVVDDQPVEYRWELLDNADPSTGFSSMARTTGFTCTAVANLIIGGQLVRPGVSPPELIAPEESVFRFILKYLEERGVLYHLTLIRK